MIIYFNNTNNITKKSIQTALQTPLLGFTWVGSTQKPDLTHLKKKVGLDRWVDMVLKNRKPIKNNGFRENQTQTQQTHLLNNTHILFFCQKNKIPTFYFNFHRIKGE